MHSFLISSHIIFNTLREPIQFLKALCDHWDKDALGVGYAYLRNYGICEEKPFRNAKCVIRRGILVTSSRK